jgi:two-component system, NarL family, response regulator NreC
VSSYNVVLADDHAMFREGIRKIIERIKGVQVSGEVNDGLELLDFLKQSSPDLVILDISMPNLRGLEAIREIKKHYPQVKVLILTMYRKKEFIRQAIMDGADGFLLKEDPGGVLIKAVQALQKGEKYLSSLLTDTLISLTQVEDKSDLLTMREREVLTLLAEGKRLQEIAEALFISVHTVRRHKANIMEKLNFKSMADLVKYAISKDYIPNPL